MTAVKEVHREVSVLSGHYGEVSNDRRTVAGLTDLDTLEAFSEITDSFSSLCSARKIFGLTGFSGLGRSMPSVSAPLALPLLRHMDTISCADSSREESATR